MYGELVIYTKGDTPLALLGVEYAPDRERTLRGLLAALGWTDSDIERVVPIVLRERLELDDAA